jgi:penicillin-binding protein 1C
VPEPLFDPVYSTVVLDRAGALLGATVADDGQWRFPPGVAVPDKFARALVEFEDRRFYWHRGVDPLALARALAGNLAAGEVKSGGSTITMQVVRLARGNPDRTLPEKAAETILALALELGHAKADILALYAAHAPFGGNVVGLEAAAWRYFGRPPERLSWAESATLAVLPNSPGLIHPGRNRDALKAKRDALLTGLWRTGALGETDWRLALAEPLPGEPRDLPREAPFFVERVRYERRRDHPGEPAARLVSSIDRGLQRQVNAVLDGQRGRLAGNGIRHAAVLVLDLASGRVLAYAGNMPARGGPRPAGEAGAPGAGGDTGDLNDMVYARRSTGSLLKPFLYAAQMEAGELLPGQLVPDIPTRFSGFAPENNTRSYSGAVPADQALARSLNVPAVRNLQSYGLHRFYDQLKTLGLSSLFRPADLYGLTLIIGGAEGTLWDLTHLYADLGRRALTGAGGAVDFPWGGWILSAEGEGTAAARAAYPFGPGAAFLALKALTQVQRPEEEGAWDSFLGSRLVAWKTGTSYGYRDAWAIGVTDRYVVGVWAGNASGEARPELRGYTVAAPLLFGVLGGLPPGGWFDSPPDLVGVDVCRDSGYLAGPDCVRRLRAAVPPRGASGQACPYCRLVHLSLDGKWQVDASRVAISAMSSERRFVLPPHLEWYYRRSNASYRPLPPWMPGAAAGGGGVAAPAAGQAVATAAERSFSLLIPESGARIYVPIDLDGQPGMTVFQAAHRDPRAALYWHLDGDFLGSTREIHQMEARPAAGKHRLTLVDAGGLRVEREFFVLSK